VGVPVFCQCNRSTQASDLGKEEQAHLAILFAPQKKTKFGSSTALLCHFCDDVSFLIADQDPAECQAKQLPNEHMPTNSTQLGALNRAFV